MSVRKLRRRAAELLHRAGGRSLALPSPMPDGGPYEHMLVSGEIQRATVDFDDLPDPIDLEAGVELPSVTLARLREHER